MSRFPLGWVSVAFVLLVLGAAFQRRAVEFEFDWSLAPRIEDNDKPDADEVLNQLLVDQSAEVPKLPGLRFVDLVQAPGRDRCALCLLTGLPHLRAPPGAFPLFTI